MKGILGVLFFIVSLGMMGYFVYLSTSKDIAESSIALMGPVVGSLLTMSGTVVAHYFSEKSDPNPVNNREHDDKHIQESA